MPLPNENGESNVAANGEAEGVVEIPEGTYKGLLDRLEELEEREQGVQQNQSAEPKSIVEQLADEAGNETQVEEMEMPENIDSMTNSQLLGFFADVVNNQAGAKLKDIELKIETHRVLREIDKAEQKYDDFWRYEGKIRELSSANPKLSIEQAYKLARSDDPPKKEEQQGENTDVRRTKTEKLLNLPQRGVVSERSQIAPSSTQNMNTGASMDDAADRAWNEAVGKDKHRVDE